MKKLSLQSAIYLKCLYKLPQNQNKENNCLALFVFVVPEKSQCLVHAMQTFKHPALWSSLKQTLDAHLVKLWFPTGVWGEWVSCMSWFSTLLFPFCWSLFFRFLGAWFLTAKAWGFTSEGKAKKEALKKKNAIFWSSLQFNYNRYNLCQVEKTHKLLHPRVWRNPATAQANP